MLTKKKAWSVILDAFQTFSYEYWDGHTKVKVRARWTEHNSKARTHWTEQEISRPT